METYATTLSKYNTAEAALEKNQPKFSQVPYTDAQATMINREVERTELAQSSAIHAAEHSTGLLGGGWGWNLAPGVAHAPRAQWVSGGNDLLLQFVLAKYMLSPYFRMATGFAGPHKAINSASMVHTAQTAYSPVAGLAFAPSLERGGAAAAAAAGASSGAAAAGGSLAAAASGAGALSLAQLHERSRTPQPQPAAPTPRGAAPQSPLPGLPPADLERTSIDEGVHSGGAPGGSGEASSWLQPFLPQATQGAGGGGAPVALQGMMPSGAINPLAPSSPIQRWLAIGHGGEDTGDKATMPPAFAGIWPGPMMAVPPGESRDGAEPHPQLQATLSALQPPTV